MNESQIEATKIKEVGNRLFKEKNYREALEQYTKAIVNFISFRIFVQILVSFTLIALNAIGCLMITKMYYYSSLRATLKLKKLYKLMTKISKLIFAWGKRWFKWQSTLRIKQKSKWPFRN